MSRWQAGQTVGGSRSATAPQAGQTRRSRQAGSPGRSSSAPWVLAPRAWSLVIGTPQPLGQHRRLAVLDVPGGGQQGKRVLPGQPPQVVDGAGPLRCAQLLLVTLPERRELLRLMAVP